MPVFLFTISFGHLFSQFLVTPLFPAYQQLTSSLLPHNFSLSPTFSRHYPNFSYTIEGKNFHAILSSPTACQPQVSPPPPGFVSQAPSPKPPPGLFCPVSSAGDCGRPCLAAGQLTAHCQPHLAEMHKCTSAHNWKYRNTVLWFWPSLPAKSFHKLSQIVG